MQLIMQRNLNVTKTNFKLVDNLQKSQNSNSKIKKTKHKTQKQKTNNKQQQQRTTNNKQQTTNKTQTQYEHIAS